LYATKTTDNNYLEFISKILLNEIDAEMFYYFVIKIDDKKTRNNIYKFFLERDNFLSSSCEEFLIKNNIHLKSSKEKARRKAVLAFKEKFYDGTLKQSDLSAIQQYNIHPDELGYYLSYTIGFGLKDEIFKYYLDNYPLQDIIFIIDKSYVQNIPPVIIDKINEKLSGISDIEEIIYLLVYREKFNNIALKRIVRNTLDNLRVQPFKTNKINDIRIYINPKYNIYIDKEDTINYMHYLSVFSSLLSTAYNLPLYVNDVLIESNSVINLINLVKHSEVSLSYKNVNCPITTKSLVFANIEVSAYARWNILDKMGEDYSDNLVISGFNIKNFVELISYIGEN
jgi:hypothetical protein